MLVLGLVSFFVLAGLGFLGGIVYLFSHKGSLPTAYSFFNYTPDPCSLLSVSEAASSLGVPISQQKRQGPACMYQSEERLELTVLIFVGRGSDRSDIQSRFHGAGEFHSVSGLGDEAEVSPGGMLILRKGKMRMNLFAMDASESSLISIARQILAKL